MKFRIVGLFLLFSFLMVGQNNLKAQSCQKVCTSKSEVKAENQTNVLAVSLEKETVEKKCTKPCTKIADVNHESPQTILASSSGLSSKEARNCIKTCNKIAKTSVSSNQAVLASLKDKPDVKTKSCDPSNCDPKNCEPKNCDPSQCSTKKSEKSNFSFLTDIFKGNPDCKPAVKEEVKAVSAKL